MQSVPIIMGEAEESRHAWTHEPGRTCTYCIWARWRYCDGCCECLDVLWFVCLLVLGVNSLLTALVFISLSSPLYLWVFVCVCQNVRCFKTHITGFPLTFSSGWGSGVHQITHAHTRTCTRYRSSPSSRRSDGWALPCFYFYPRALSVCVCFLMFASRETWSQIPAS